MPRLYCAFDIEIAHPLPEGFEDWKAFRPLGITCAATLTSGGELRLWYGKNADGSPADRMTVEETKQMVAYLQAQAAAGCIPLTWNGLGFDFDILAEESGMYAECKALALEHVDMMFHIFCARGFAIGLDKAAKGMALPGKLEGMDGADAPRYWIEGRRAEVLRYVEQDARTTLELAHKAEKQRQLGWFSGTGRFLTLPLPRGWLTAREAMQLPLPDTRGLRNPWQRSKFTGWLKE